MTQTQSQTQIDTAVEPKESKRKILSGSNLLVGFIFILVALPIVLHSVIQVTFSPVLSNSMKPQVSKGDLLLTKDTMARDLKLGDVVAVRDAKTYEFYTHRIVKIQKNNDLLDITTKGDNNPTVDAGILQVAPSASLPRAVGHVHFLGTVIDFLSSKTGRMLSGLSLLLSALLSLVRLAHRRMHAKSGSPSRDGVHEQPHNQSEIGTTA